MPEPRFDSWEVDDSKAPTAPIPLESPLEQASPTQLASSDTQNGPTSEFTNNHFRIGYKRQETARFEPARKPDPSETTLSPEEQRIIDDTRRAIKGNRDNKWD
jgi:hypothetical protein